MNNDDQTQTITEPQVQTPAPQSSKTNRKPIWPLLAVGLLVLLLAAAGWGYQQHSQASAAKKDLASVKTKLTAAESQNKKLSDELDQRKETTGEENIDKSAFQAVFLKNDQVYFGKITKLTETQVVLTDIFYLQDGTAGGDANNTTGSVSLVKLGDELHAPQDTMYIERAELNYWENLKPDGQVAKAIAEYQKQNP